jgi:hypothetical protein
MVGIEVCLGKREAAEMTPAPSGYAMPPEWSPQSAIWLSWPVNDPRHWGGEKRDIIHAKFAEIVEKSGITFIGPKPEHIRMMGDKITAKDAIQTAGVPVVPGSDGEGSRRCIRHRRRNRSGITRCIDVRIG